jgi:ABC-2 type transport system ATP-binding protein
VADEAVIHTENLAKTYTDFWGRPRVYALHPLSIDVYRGEIFGIIGPNGSGKSTTMKLLLGLIFPTSGKAQVLGKPPHSIDAKMKIGFLPEESYLYPFLSGEETLDFFGRMFHIPHAERRRRIDKLISLFGMDKARHRRVREYSKGMQRRISFAQALINDPDVVFLDEPTSGLDPLSSRQIKDLILDLKKQGKTVFLSSHLLADLQDVCDRICILFEGKLRKYGAVKELLTNRDLVSITCSDLSPDALARIRQAIEKEGARIVSCENTLENLESVFLKTVQEAKHTDGNAP